MAEYPSVFPEGPVFAIGPGGAQARLPRRRARRPGREPPAEANEGAWKGLLEDAVAAFNEELRRTGAPYACRLHEDETGFLLRVAHLDETLPRPEEPENRTDPAADAVEELLEPADLPAWLARLRAGLGILLDREV